MCISVVDAPPIGRYARCVGSCASITTASATDRGCDAEPANDGWLKDAGQTCHVRTTARSPGILRWPGRPRHSECHSRGGDISWRSVAYGARREDADGQNRRRSNDYGLAAVSCSPSEVRHPRHDRADRGSRPRCGGRICARKAPAANPQIVLENGRPISGLSDRVVAGLYAVFSRPGRLLRVPITRDRVIKAILCAQRVAGLPEQGLHILRHTFCSHLAMRSARVPSMSSPGTRT